MSSTTRAAPKALAVAVADAWQGRGLGRLLLQRLECHAAASGVRQLYADTLYDNKAMLGLAQDTGFSAARRGRGAGLVRLEKDLAPPPGLFLVTNGPPQRWRREAIPPLLVRPFLFTSWPALCRPSTPGCIGQQGMMRGQARA